MDNEPQPGIELEYQIAQIRPATACLLTVNQIGAQLITKKNQVMWCDPEPQKLDENVKWRRPRL